MDIKEIELVTQGKTALVDELDFPEVSCYRWRGIKRNTGDWHALTRIFGKTVYMHQIVLQTKSSIDHVNGDGLDNRRVNLRLATRSQNAMNSRKQNRQTASKYKGVVLHLGYGRVKRWQARIHKDGATTSLGYFATESEAAAAYNEAAHKMFGEFARPNEME